MKEKLSNKQVKKLIVLSKAVALHVFVHHEFECTRLDETAGNLFKFLTKHSLYDDVFGAFTQITETEQK